MNRGFAASTGAAGFGGTADGFVTNDFGGAGGFGASTGGFTAVGGA
jgi:hypothetical protein